MRALQIITGRRKGADRARPQRVVFRRALTRDIVLVVRMRPRGDSS